MQDADEELIGLVPRVCYRKYDRSDEKGLQKYAVPERLAIHLPECFEPDLDDPTIRPQGIGDNDFHILGEGWHSLVISGTFNIPSVGSHRVAIKRIAVEKQAKVNLYIHTILLYELQTCLNYPHPNIAKIYRVFWEPAEQANTLRHLWIVTERMDLSLHHFLHSTFVRSEYMDEANPVKVKCIHVAAVAAQLFKAIAFLHENDIVHGDISPKNIGLNAATLTIKLFDYGILGYANSHIKHNANKGLHWLYRTPEQCLGSKSDFSDLNSEAQFAQSHVRALWIKTYGRRLAEWYRRTAYEQVDSTIFNADRKLRPSAAECLTFPFLEEINDRYDARHLFDSTGEEAEKEQKLAERLGHICTQLKPIEKGPDQVATT